jgi:hypothetical protein
VALECSSACAAQGAVVAGLRLTKFAKSSERAVEAALSWLIGCCTKNDPLPARAWWRIAGLLAALIGKDATSPELRAYWCAPAILGVIGVWRGLDRWAAILPARLSRSIEPSEFFKTARRLETWFAVCRMGAASAFHYSFAPSMFLRWKRAPKAWCLYCMKDMQDANFASAMMDENRVFLRTPRAAFR